MAINIVSTALPIAVLQLAVLPFLARFMGGDEYGIVVTVASFFSFCPATIGNVLNNIRLIRSKDYRDRGLSGDFGVLLCAGLAVTLVATVAYMAISFPLDWLGVLLVSSTSLMWLVQAYGVVAYLIKLDYPGILLNNVWMALGYCGGLALYFLTGRWELVYFSGQLFSVLYILKTTDIIFERVHSTPLFSSTLKETLYLGSSSLLSQISTYCDRLILFPLLGGEAVSVYYVSTLLAKVVSMLSSSVNSVVLSYLAKGGKEKTSRIWSTLLVGLFVCCAGYAIVMVVARPCLAFLYPQFLDEALRFLPVTSATAFVTVLFRLANPFVLNSLSAAWQIFIAITSASIYLFSALVLLQLFGLMGFCEGMLVAECCKLMLTLAVYRFGKVRT